MSNNLSFPSLHCIYQEAMENVQSQNLQTALSLLREAAGYGHLKSMQALVKLLKKEKDRTARLEADHLMLNAFGHGVKGYEFPVANMLFEGLGYYSRLPLECYNRQRAVQILLYEKDSPKKCLLLGRFLMNAKKSFTYHNKEDALSYPKAKAAPASQLAYAPQQAIQWLERANCAEGYALISEYYWKQKETELAVQYYNKAKLTLGEKSPSYTLKAMGAKVERHLSMQTPEEKLAFLFADDDPSYRLSVLKKALWAVTSEGYCRIMKETLDRGLYDPEAEEWKLLYPLRKEIQILFDKYNKLSQP